MTSSVHKNCQLSRSHQHALQNKTDKKDGYRQQNVRQQQKLISIIDYDVCILEYRKPHPSFWMTPVSMTLRDLEASFQGHDIIQRQISRRWYKIEL